MTCQYSAVEPITAGFLYASSLTGGPNWPPGRYYYWPARPRTQRALGCVFDSIRNQVSTPGFRQHCNECPLKARTPTRPTPDRGRTPYGRKTETVWSLPEQRAKSSTSMITCVARCGTAVMELSAHAGGRAGAEATLARYLGKAWQKSKAIEKVSFNAWRLIDGMSIDGMTASPAGVVYE